jgi:hypothetical protein
VGSIPITRSKTPGLRDAAQPFFIALYSLKTVLIDPPPTQCRDSFIAIFNEL